MVSLKLGDLEEKVPEVPGIVGLSGMGLAGETSHGE